MVKVYAITLVLGTLGLLVFILGGTLAENLGRPEKDPGERYGLAGKAVVGAVVGFGMGGLSAEFSPLDFGWPTSLMIAVAAAGLSILWVRYATSQSRSG
ncbi:MAG TPA: hypothetical protein VGB33_10500 [Acidimicrobiia bacterium]|jgi:hypothetical protein